MQSSSLPGSLRPKMRPADHAAKALQASSDDTANDAASTDLTDTPAKVAAAATTTVSLPRNEVMLLGTFGKSEALHALIRMPSGTVREVKVGARVSGAQVIAVAEAELILRSRSGTRRLLMP